MGPTLAAIQAGFDRAVMAGRDVTGTLRVGFIGAASGMFVMDLAAEFRQKYPGCEVQIRENQFSDGHAGLLRQDVIDVLLATLPVDEPVMVVGPVLIREDRLLAVSARHPFGAKPFEWALMWRAAAETAVVRAFAEVARCSRASSMG